MQERFAQFGAQPRRQHTAGVRGADPRERVRWGEIIKAANITAQ